MGVSAQLESRGYRRVGALHRRPSREISGSPWSIGCETCDRGYVDFAQVGPYLAELGAKAVRLQAGWARCDPGDGNFQWEWLDAIVDSAVAQGVQPWLQTSYGNPAYPGGGGIGLAQGLPESPVALRAWDRWVAALVTRYAHRVNTWEVWNEPDHGPGITPSIYAAFFVRTASIIRQVQLPARIVGLALAGPTDYAQGFLTTLRDENQTHLLDEVCFHFYPHNPDDAFDQVEVLSYLVDEFAPHATLRQGETGAPSETQRFLAMGQFDWSPRKQAVWNLRRMLAHHARGIPMNLFQLADMQYEKRDGARFDGRNPKGLLHIHPDKSVSHRKASFFAAQHVFSLLDDAYPLRRLEPHRVEPSSGVACYAWQRADAETPTLLVWWLASAPPHLADPPLRTVKLPRPPFQEPLLFDFLSGDCFEEPNRGEVTCRDLPLTDAPLALIERASINV